MKRLLLHIAIALLTFSLGVSVQFLERKYQARVLSEVEAINLTYRFDKASQRGDQRALDYLLADDYHIRVTNEHLIEPNRPPVIDFDKAATIAQFTDLQKQCVIRTLNIQAHADITKVTVTGDLTARCTFAEANEKIELFHITHTFSQRQGRLRLIHSQFSAQPIPQRWQPGYQD